MHALGVGEGCGYLKAQLVCSASEGTEFKLNRPTFGSTYVKETGMSPLEIYEDARHRVGAMETGKKALPESMLLGQMSEGSGVNSKCSFR